MIKDIIEEILNDKELLEMIEDYKQLFRNEFCDIIIKDGIINLIFDIIPNDSKEKFFEYKKECEDNLIISGRKYETIRIKIRERIKEIIHDLNLKGNFQ